MLRYGIVGYGVMGQRRFHAVNANRTGEVVAVCGFGTDPVPPDLAAPDADAIFADPRIDAVFICTVNALNQPLAIKAMRAGKHVFCEKPPAFDAAGVEEIRRVEAETGRVLMYGFNHRHHGATARMKAILDSGELGRVLWMRGRYGKSIDEAYLNTWRADPKLAGGGILIDQGIHMLDLMCHLGGEFDEVQSVMSSLYWDTPGAEDNVFAILRNSTTGCCASIHSTMTQWRHIFSLEVCLERGYLVLNGLKTGSNSYGVEELVVGRNRSTAPAATHEHETSERWDTDESWNVEARLFADWIASGRPGLGAGDSASALRAMRLVDRIYAGEMPASPRLHRRLNGGDVAPRTLEPAATAVGANGQ